MIRIIEQTQEEKEKMYSKSSKRKLIEMLINCNNYLNIILEQNRKELELKLKLEDVTEILRDGRRLNFQYRERNKHLEKENRTLKKAIKELKRVKFDDDKKIELFHLINAKLNEDIQNFKKRPLWQRILNIN